VSLKTYIKDGVKYADGIFSDISARKQAEEELRLFKTLINRSNDAPLVDDAGTGRILGVINKGCVILGYSREEL